MSAADLAELHGLTAHLVTRHEQDRGVRPTDATIIDRIVSEQGTTIIVALVDTEHPPGQTGQRIHQRVALVAVSPDIRVTCFHIRAIQMPEVISAFAKIAVIIWKQRRQKHKDSAPEP